MNNAQVARTFNSIAELLELKGESPFKVRAYQKGAKVLEGLTVDVAELARQEKLKDLPGIGDALSKKIAELVATGRLEYYERLLAEFPPGTVTLMEVPGIGPKTALKLAKDLGVTSLGELEQALQDGRVAGLPGLGQKSAENILRHLESLRRKDTRTPIGQALPIVETVLAALAAEPGVQAIEPAGSLRRFRETIGDIDIMGTARQPGAVLQAFTRLPQVTEVLALGETKASAVLEGGLQVDVRLVEPDSFGSLLQYFTGSKEHNVALRERGVKQGLKLSEYGITDARSAVLEKFDDEVAFYSRLGLQYIPPELREAQGEIELAARHALPRLVEAGDIRGDLHVHTEWSDGHGSLEAMARAARDRGHLYVAITDHSVGRAVARGLSRERLQQQIAEVRRLNDSLGDITILSGVELDIRADGSLDLPDDLLAQLDVVVASVHSAMSQEEPRMTERVLKALANPHVDILAHPTCRILGERESVSLDLEAVFQAAARYGKALEVNAMPQRLDLKDVHIRRATELGVKLAISTDSHSPEHLALMRFGIGMARRGWCQAPSIINTWPLEELKAFLRRDGA